MKLVITQHTTSEWNAVGRIQGQTDISLNSRGRADALRLGAALSGLKIDFIVSSDLKRAKETASAINTVLNLPLRFDDRLRECSFGKIEGLTEQQVVDKYGAQIIPSFSDQYRNYDFRPFGGERREDVLVRHMEVLNSLVKTDTANIPLLVGHGLGMNTLLHSLGYDAGLKQGEFQIIEFTI